MVNIVVNSVIVKKKLRNNTYLVVTNPIFFKLTQIPQILPIHHSTLLPSLSFRFIAALAWTIKRKVITVLMA